MNNNIVYQIEKYWTSLLIILAIIYTIVIKSDMLNSFTLCTGVLCVALVAKGNIWNYPVGIVNVIAYAYISYQNKLFGEAALYVFFFVPINIIGYFIWKKNIKQHTVISKKLTTKKRIVLFIITSLLTIILAIVLKNIPEQNHPYIDAFITVLSIVATLLMIRRYSEQWILYIILNCFCVLLWSIRHLTGSESGLSMIGMWSIFLINSCFGYYSWTRKLTQEKAK